MPKEDIQPAAPTGDTRPVEQPAVHQQESKSPLKQIRTFQGDVAEALNRQKESLVSIQRAEHSSKSRKNPESKTSTATAQKRKRVFFLFLGAVILFILGVIGIWYAYNEFISNATTPTMEGHESRFFTPDTEEEIAPAAPARDSLINTVSFATRNQVPGEIKHLILPLSTSELFDILNTKAPGSLVRAFDPLFMLGTLGESTFLIIKLSSFENAFAGMLAWEKDLYPDIGALFATREVLRDILPDSELVFRDVTDRNKDLRLLEFGEQDVILYSFFGNNMLIITDKIETLMVIMERLTREKLSR
jgi:hypothetical protein